MISTALSMSFRSFQEGISARVPFRYSSIASSPVMSLLRMILAITGSIPYFLPIPWKSAFFAVFSSYHMVLRNFNMNSDKKQAGTGFHACPGLTSLLFIFFGRTVLGILCSFLCCKTLLNSLAVFLLRLSLCVGSRSTLCICTLCCLLSRCCSRCSFHSILSCADFLFHYQPQCTCNAY